MEIDESRELRASCPLYVLPTMQVRGTFTKSQLTQPGTQNKAETHVDADTNDAVDLPRSIMRWHAS